jgi:hypothetical protein
MRVIIFVGDPVVGGDGARRPFLKPGFKDNVDKMFADIGEFGGEVFWDEDWGFGNAKFDGAGVFAVQVGQEVIVALSGEGFIEGFSQ